MNNTRRQLEEILLKLLLKQNTEDVVQQIINLQQNETLLQNNPSLHDYYTKHIKSFCQSNYSDILLQIKENNINLKNQFCSLFNEHAHKSKAEIRKQIRKYYSNNKYDKIPEDLLYGYLPFGDGAKTINNIRLVLDILVKGDEVNESIIIQFINNLFMEMNQEEKEKLVLKLIDEFFLVDKNKRHKLIRSLYLENEKNGTPDIMSTALPSSKDYLILKIKILQHKTMSSETTQFMLLSNTPLYELLKMIIIMNQVNIDLFEIKYQNKFIDSSSLNYLTPLYEIFNLQSINANNEIELYISNSVIIDDENIYFTKSNLKENIQQKFNNSDYFDTTDIIPPGDYFPNNEKQLFPNLRYVKFESLIPYLQDKTKDSYLLLHLLIGFYNHDINQPYFRNIKKENMIGYHFYQHKSLLGIKDKHLQAYCGYKIIDKSQIKANKDNHIDSIFKYRIYSFEDYFSNIGNVATLATNRINFEDFVEDIINTFIQTKSFELIQKLINTIKNFNLEDVLLFRVYLHFNTLFDEIVKIETKENNYVLDYFNKLFNLMKLFSFDEFSLAYCVDFYFHMIDYFLKYPVKYKEIVSNKEFNKLLIQLLQSINILSNREARKHAVFLSFFKYNIDEQVFNSVILIISQSNYYLTNNNLVKKELLSIITNYNCVLPPFAIDDDISTWELNAILIQLLHSHQYINYSKENDLLVSDFGLSFFYLIKTSQCPNSLYKKLSILTNNIKSSYDKITYLINYFKHKSNKTNIYLTQTDNMIYVSNQRETSKDLKLIGWISVLGEKPENVVSICVNDNRKKIVQYRQGKIIKTVAEEENALDFIDNTSNNNDKTFNNLTNQNNNNLAQSCLYFYINYNLVNKTPKVKNTQSVLHFFKIDRYPIIYLFLFKYSINEEEFTQLQDIYQSMFQSNQLSLELIDPTEKDQLNKKIQKLLNNLFKSN